MMDFSGVRVLVIGLGESGAASSKAAAELGATVCVVDSQSKPTRADAVGELTSMGIEVRLGIEVPGDMSGYDLIITSPGVPEGAPVIKEAAAAGIRIISELEFGYKLLRENTIVAVTGTNGKTTTTKLIGEMMNSQGRKAFTCGNIGNPLTGLYGRVSQEDFLIAEVSSFQLRYIEDFHAKVGVVLNVAPDHFDWHRDFDDYLGAKMRIVENMNEDEYLVYNLEDSACRMIAKRSKGINIAFSAAKRPEGTVWLEDGWVVTGHPLEAGRVLPINELKLAGAHNLDNLMAAVASSLVVGQDRSNVRKAAGGFTGLEHRIEFVDRVGEVSFYNDSKATNPHAALHAIRSFDEHTVAIMGGRNKGLDFGDVADEVCTRVRDGRMRGLVLIGESAPQIKAELERACRSDVNGYIVIAHDLYDSVEKAFELAGGEGVVLFSPACASFDMFKNYEDRGRSFKESVSILKGIGDSARGK